MKRYLTVYLAGAINGCTDEECVDWREHIIQNWKCHTLNPMDRDYRNREDGCYREIVDLDKRDIRLADVIVVNYVKPSVGTSMEVFYAWTLGKPIIVVAPKNVKISPWLQYHSSSIVHSFKEAEEKVYWYDY